MNKFFKIASLLLAMGTIVALSVFKNFCPLLNEFPRPTGRYSVGITYEHWVFPGLHYVPQERNEFNVQIFYPSVSGKVQKFPYQPEKMEVLKKVLPSYFWGPSFVWNCLLGAIYSYAHSGAPIAEGESRYPFLIYLPGMASIDLHNLYLEELASHGYVIVAIEPPFDTLISLFAKNKLIELDPRLAKAVKENNREEIYKYRDEAHVRWSSYIEAVLSKLKQLNEDAQSMFYQKLDVDKIGVIGHSHGGAVALDFCQKNKVCKAGINMDGWTKTYNSSNRFDTPFLFMLSQGMDQPGIRELIENNQRPEFEHVVIQGAGHDAFNDMVLQKSLVETFGFSPVNYLKVVDEIRRKIVVFFDKYLK